jgi:hypothetical protein
MRGVRVVAERRPHLPHARVQAMLEIHVHSITPDGLTELVTPHEPTRSAHEQQEHFVWLRRQLYDLAVFAQDLVPRIQLEFSKFPGWRHVHLKITQSLPNAP